ncbi:MULTISPECIES: TetR/AcrR family transcriptional regulator [unclassified Pseudomonas]|uniref:TetR/AcrR family transcriptional regulator n=1 Tax=unclassified Pseudomonas TaxID=196821 RepID=UPI00131C409D|nr:MULTISPECIES: TetR/AcrR family transcriptional regulator [unclassified Pseudomonas]
MTASRRIPRGDGDLTRGRILEAAGQLFAHAGYAETSSKAVAALAQVDVAAINYHFGGRAGLYQAVLLEGHRRLISIDDLQQIDAGQDSAEEKLGRLIDHLVERIYLERGWPIRVCAREMLSPTVHSDVLINDGVMPKAEIICGLVAAIIGLPKGDPVVTRCMVNVMAPCLMLLVGGEAAPPPVISILAMPSHTLSDHLKGFAIAGLRGIKYSLIADKSYSD